MSKVNTENILHLEQPLAKVPHEQLRKVFRTSQRILDRDFLALTASSNEIVSNEAEEDASAEAAISSLDAMISRVESMKRKIADVHSHSTVPAQTALRTRMHHLGTLESMSSTQDPLYSQWIDTRMDRWLVDWMLRNGRFDSARALSQAKDIQNLVDIELFADIRRIRDALERQSCSEALAWCNENKAALRKIKSTLEFDLRLQEFIELARAGKSLPAIAYSKKQLAPWYETHMAQIQQAMALLAYTPHSSAPKSPAYKRLYDVARWESLAHAFTDTAYTLAALSTSSLLNLALYAGLVALKHPACFGPVSHEASTPHSPGKNRDCPVCDASGLGALAQEVPSSNHLNSTLVCALSGRIMDDQNPPMAFRNGYVYSYQALEEMALNNGGIVTCPRSGQSCSFNELRKVYIS